MLYMFYPSDQGEMDMQMKKIAGFVVKPQPVLHVRICAPWGTEQFFVAEFQKAFRQENPSDFRVDEQIKVCFSFQRLYQPAVAFPMGESNPPLRQSVEQIYRFTGS